MSNQEPIAGISLERFAELGAEVSHTEDPEEQARIVESLGVPRPNWEAAKQGWTARMQDMSDMGQTASAYMPMYQAAVARKQGTVEVSFEDWASMEAASQVFGIQGMLAHYGIDMNTWTQIAGHWNSQLASNPMQLGMQRNSIHQQETARLRSGGQPKPVNIQRSAPAAPPQPAAPQHASPPHASPPHASPPHAAPPHAAPPHAAPGGGFSVGQQVLVQWSDGNKYPGTVAETKVDQANVSFPNGQQVWVEFRWLSPGA